MSRYVKIAWNKHFLTALLTCKAQWATAKGMTKDGYRRVLCGERFLDLLFYLLQVDGVSAGMENIKDNNCIRSDFINDLVTPDDFKTDISQDAF